MQTIDKLLDDDFVELCYQHFLGRKSDQGGKHHYVEQLKNGLSRLNLIKSLVSSPEYFNILIQDLFATVRLPNLRQLRPANYEFSRISGRSDSVLVFHAKDESDYDWLESRILEHGYYEKPGVWSLAIDLDKQVIAEIVSNFSPKCCLEIGCATGPVLKLLQDKNIQAHGVEISHLALGLAYPDIKRRIHYGDLLTLNLKSEYDFVFGMDIFEHLNPNKLFLYLRRCYDLMPGGGFLFANIPAFGKDNVFGEVFEIYLEDWISESESEGLLSRLHVDDKGWPINGHLTWATARWWQKAFECVGFEREEKIEQAVHEVYGKFMQTGAPARKSLFIFRKGISNVAVKSIIETIRQNRSLEV